MSPLHLKSQAIALPLPTCPKVPMASTQAIYEQVKEKVQVALKPTIEIDEVKRAQQVAEITESGHFQELIETSQGDSRTAAAGRRPTQR